MAVLQIDNAVMVKLNWSHVGRPAINVIGGIQTGTLPPIDQVFANTLDTAVKAGFTANMAAMYTPDTILQNVSIRDLRTPNNFEFVGAGAEVAGDTVGGTPLPRQVAFVISLRTALAGRSFRGRIYLPGGPESQNEAGGLASGAFQNNAIAFIQSVRDAFIAQGFDMAVLSRPADARTIPEKTFAARNGQATQVVSILSHGTGWETQRRRRGRLP
jgi:hypothetical protein